MKPSSGCNLKETLIYNWQHLKIRRSRLHKLYYVMLSCYVVMLCCHVVLGWVGFCCVFLLGFLCFVLLCCVTMIKKCKRDLVILRRCQSPFKLEPEDGFMTAEIL